MKCVNILWFDDDLLPRGDGITLQRKRLQPWLRWFYTVGAKNGVRLIETNSLRLLGEILKSRAEVDQLHPDYIHGLLIDQLHHPDASSSYTLAELDSTLAHIRLLPQDAGTQLIELIKLPLTTTGAPFWLSSYCNRSVALFSTQSADDTRLDLGFQLQQVGMHSVSILQKKVFIDSGEPPTPDARFLEWIDSVVKSRGGS